MRERWPREHAEKLLRAWRESGEPIGDFARDRGLDASKLYYWRRALKVSRRASTKQPAHGRLVPVLVRTSAPSIDAEWVAKLVRALFAAAER